MRYFLAVPALLIMFGSAQAETKCGPGEFYRPSLNRCDMKDGNPAFAYVHRARATVARAHAPTNKVVVCMSEGCVRAQEAKMTE